MRVLVTGGAGYIGSVAVAELIRARHEVVVYDNFSKGHTTAIPAGVPVIRGDVSDRPALDRAFAEHKIEAVMHFAASIEAGESMRVPEKFFRNNSAATLTLLEAILAAKIRRFVFSSTAALYGDPEHIPIREDDPLRPTNVYGESKLIVERMLSWFARIHGLRYASLRYFNAAGATETLGEAHDPETHLIPLVLKVALGQRDNVSIFGTDYDTRDGTCVRDYIHVSDLARAHVLALEALERDSQLIFNLGNGIGFTVREVIDVARRVTGHKIPAIEAPRRSGDPAVLVASSEKIQKELGWRPEFRDLEQIIASAWKWMRARPNGYSQTRDAAHQSTPTPQA